MLMAVVRVYHPIPDTSLIGKDHRHPTGGGSGPRCRGH
jgi:hypothetical protein